MRLAATLAVFVGLLGACAGPASSAPVASSLQSHLEESPDVSEIRLADVALFSWDTAIVFGPYTTSDELIKYIGEDTGSGPTEAVKVSDEYNLIVFRSGERVVAEELIPRAIVDFVTKDLPMMITKTDSTLSVRGGDPPVLGRP